MKHPKSYDTTPEIRARMGRVHLKRGRAETLLAKALWHRGLRYRLNWKALPGSPDIAIAAKKLAVFVDGEFWHGQDWERRKARLKKDRDYWIEKIEENIARDARNDAKLRELGWTPIHFWEKEVLKGLETCVARVLAAAGMAEAAVDTEGPPDCMAEAAPDIADPADTAKELGAPGTGPERRSSMEQILFIRLPRIVPDEREQPDAPLSGVVSVPPDDPDQRALLMGRLAPLGDCRWTEALGNGTLLLRSELAAEALRRRLPELLGPGEDGLPRPFCLLSPEALRAELETLPDWWRAEGIRLAIFPKEGLALDAAEAAVSELRGRVRRATGALAVYVGLTGERADMDRYLLFQMLGRSVFVRSPRRLQALLAETGTSGR